MRTRQAGAIGSGILTRRTVTSRLAMFARGLTCGYSSLPGWCVPGAYRAGTHGNYQRFKGG
jgi:hypothetical protein